MKVMQRIFPSRNYITIDTKGDSEIVFNPTVTNNATKVSVEGVEVLGDDVLKVSKGRWAFRSDDFLNGKVLANGQREVMNRKIYNVAIVYDDEDGEPNISTTYIDPTSVVPLDGARVQLAGISEISTKEKQEDIILLLQGIAEGFVKPELFKNQHYQNAIQYISDIENIENGLYEVELSGVFRTGSSGNFLFGSFNNVAGFLTVSDTEFRYSFARCPCDVALSGNQGQKIVKGYLDVNSANADPFSYPPALFVTNLDGSAVGQDYMQQFDTLIFFDRTMKKVG